MTPSAEKPPLFVVHGAGGGILFLREFSDALRGVRQIFGLRGYRLDEPSAWDVSIHAMADRYAEEIASARPGPYLLGGYSSGGTIALETARVLRRAGHEVPLVVLFECWPWGDATQPKWIRHARLLRYFLTDGYRPIRSYFWHIAGNRLRAVRSRLPLSELADQEQREPEPEPERDDVHEFFLHTLKMLSEFEFVSYDIPAVLLKADMYWPHLPRDYKWQRLLKHPLRIQIVEGHHITMWHREHAESLAATVDAILNGAFTGETPDFSASWNR